MLMALHTPPRLLSTLWRNLQTPPLGTENPGPRGQPALTHHVGCFTGAPRLISTQEDGRGIWLWQGGEEEHLTTAQGPWHSKFIPVVPKKLMPNSSCAHLQNWVRGTLRPENSEGWRSARLGSSNKEFCQPSSPVSPHPDKDLNHSLPGG